AVALADALVQRGHRVSVLTDARGARFQSGVDVRAVPATRLSGGPVARALGAVRLGMGVLAAAWHLKRDRVRLLVGFGGYPSVPPVLAARLLGVPVVLVEQNAVLGRANRRLAGMARVVATAFPEVEALGSAAHRFTGIPVRPAVVAARARPYRPSADEEPFHLLVFGGSQGAHAFAETVPAACALLPANLRRRLRIVQQARPEDETAVRAAYGDLAMDVEVAPFFDDLPARMAASQLVIARAGASTIAELLTIGRPAVLVPYPHAMDDHQTANARAIDAAGAAWLMPQPAFTAEALARRLETVLTLPDCIAARAELAHSLGRTDAAERLADLAESLLVPAKTAPGAALRSLAP
ncbi:MAG: UDP-N-acetylglucosamine--N-acetylmuramyl-(pentapeptide) pyrophosphoryl-undecaprenol N-acetylglucosamine transferase, partial [Alphaproteobacteria bacterium]|nr:UDP-N-acetylglucosamine--N-acetylmuramyl-(pentapeptide) pyrophosphoryl-undecaprenol N-acetylglucosamine transferase [Alphaproteobacteria bacterium]